MLKSNLYAILEVNSSTLNLVVIEKGDSFTHLFYSKQTEYEGFESGRFNNAEELFVLIQQSFKECEAKTNISINNFYVVLPQRFFRTNIQERSKLLGNKSVENKDIDRALSKFFVSDSGFKAVNLFPLSYKIDNISYSEPPVGHTGKTFSVVVEQLALDESIEELFSTCAKRLGKSVTFFASSLLALHKVNQTSIIEKSIFVALNERTTDVCLCENNQILHTASVEWGGEYVYLALMDLLNIDRDCATKLIAKLNFNLPIADGGKYIIADYNHASFPISEVNKHAITTLFFIVKEINKQIATLNKGKLPIYFFGNEICNIRGIKDILENFTETETIVLKTDKIEKIDYTMLALLDILTKSESNKGYNFCNLLKTKFNLR